MSWTEASTNMLTTTVLSDETRGRESLTVKTRLRSTTHGSDNIIHKSTCQVYKSTARRRNNELPSSMLTSTINKRLSRRKSPHHPSYKGHITTFAIFFMLMLTNKCLAMSAKYKVPLIISDATEQSGYKTSLQDEEQMVTLRTAIPISNTVSVEDLDFQSVTYIPKWGDDVTDVLLISGRDHVYMINNTIIPESGQIKIVERLTWRTDDRLKGECQLMGKKTYECQNFIRTVVLQKNDAEMLYVCGTNAYTPTCRGYLRQNFNAPEGQNSVKLYEERCKDANCPAPQNPTMRSVSLYANTSSGYQLFSALVYDFMGRQPTVTKRKIMSDEGMVTTDDLWFNEPDFIKAVEYGDKVYLFFREVAKEFESGSPRDVVYGRVAQVCRDDIGRLDKPHRWSTFLKARITCNPEGDTLQFNNLTAVSDIQKVIGEDGREVDVVFATFTTPWGWSDVSVSAVCMFPLQESIESVFTNGQFLQKVNLDTDDPDLVYMDAKYQAVPVQPRHVPIPRPGECGVQYTQKGLDFSDEHPLMYDAIYPAFKRPIFVTEADTRVTEIAVDDEAGGTQKVMMYLGTENGQLLKIRTRIGITDGAKAICIEKSGMANKEHCPKDMCGIQKLNITRTVYGPAALIAFSAYVVHVPLAKCDNLPDRCCNLIPDCGWSFENSRCEVRTPLNTMDLEPTLRDDEEWPTSCKLVLPPDDESEISHDRPKPAKCNCSKKRKKSCKHKKPRGRMSNDLVIPGSILDDELLDLIDGNENPYRSDFREVFNDRIMSQVEDLFVETMAGLPDEKQRENLKKQLEDVMVSTANLVLTNHKQEYCLPTPTVNHLTHVYPLLVREIELWHQTALKKMTSHPFPVRCWSQSKFDQPCTTKITFSVPLVNVLWEPLSKLIHDFQGECRSIHTKVTPAQLIIPELEAPSGCKPLLGLQSCKDASSSLPHCQPKSCTFPKYSVDIRAFFRHANDSRQFLENSDDIGPLFKPVNVTLSETESIHGHLEVYMTDQPFTIDYSPVAEKVKISFRYAAIRDCSLSDPGCIGSGTRCNPSVEGTIGQWYQWIAKKMSLKMRDCSREIRRETMSRDERGIDLSQEQQLRIMNIVKPVSPRCKRTHGRVRAPPIEVWSDIVLKAKRVGGVFGENGNYSIIEFHRHEDVVKFFKNMCSFETPSVRRANMNKKIMRSHNKYSLVEVMATREAPLVIKRDKKTQKLWLTFFSHKI